MMSSGGKSRGLELLLADQDIGFKALPFDEIEHHYFDMIEKQREIATIVSLLTKQPQVTTGLPRQFDDIINGIAQKYYGKKAILRSNSLREDGTHSFAGVYDSVIVENVTPETIRAGLRKVYDSFFSEKAVKYRREHGIREDKMGIVLQEFIEPDFAGVMYTSNPSFPKDLTIEFTKGRNKIVDSSEKPFIVDYDKATKRRIFESDYRRDIPKNLALDKLMEIGIWHEQRHGPLDMEFLIKDGEVYLVQRRPITDLKEPVEVKIPRYTKSQLIGVTNVIRGSGKVTLPVVKPQPYGDLLQRGYVMSNIDSAMTLNMYSDWLKFIVRMDATYSDGYVLIIPEFNQRPLFSSLSGINFETDIDSMTPNKKAVITTNSASIASHIMTIARERGVAYAGFQNGEKSFEPVRTRDVLSIYFKGRQAHVYKEKVAPKSIRELHPEMKYETGWMDNNYLFVQTSGFLESDKPYSLDLQLFLERQTGKKWKFKPFDDVMGGLFVDAKKRAIFMRIAKQEGEYHRWYLGSVGMGREYGCRSVPKRQFNALMDAYAKHLTH